MKSIINKWLEKSTVTIISDIGVFGLSLYPVFVIACIIGVYLTMAGAKEKGVKLSSLSFIVYLLLKVMSSV